MGHNHPATAVSGQPEGVHRISFAIFCLQQVEVDFPPAQKNEVRHSVSERQREGALDRKTFGHAKSDGTRVGLPTNVLVPDHLAACEAPGTYLEDKVCECGRHDPQSTPLRSNWGQEIEQDEERRKSRRTSRE